MLFNIKMTLVNTHVQELRKIRTYDIRYYTKNPYWQRYFIV